jgi:hypothetical protein
MVQQLRAKSAKLSCSPGSSKIPSYLNPLMYTSCQNHKASCIAHLPSLTNLALSKLAAA